jgi:hypothetical protein
MCQPGWSTERTAWAAGATAAAISARCRFIASCCSRQNQGCAFAPLRAYRTEDVDGGGTLVKRRAWAGAALGPATGDLVLLAYASFVGEPGFYRAAVECLRARDFLQAHGKAF